MQRIYKARKDNFTIISYSVFTLVYTIVGVPFFARFNDFLKQYFNSTFTRVMLYIIFSITICVIAYKVINKLMTSYASSTELIITQETIKKGRNDKATILTWTDSMQVLQISDFQSSLLTKNYPFEFNFDDKYAFIIAEKNYDKRTGCVVITTIDWCLDDIADFKKFCADIGYPVQSISAEESNTYFPYLEQ